MVGSRLGLGLGTRLQLDRGAQLADRRHGGEFGVVRIGAVGRPVCDDADLVQGESALPHPLRAARELL
ncbi:MAG: hypothetical protein QOJ80_4597, partial [Mycobacterium sp.]|nr:hypothetical protein [Mycobacterium sp.]